MKVAVCGKGGSGKSTVTTLLAKELAGRGRKVLVIDSDESNYGLSRQLGVDLPLDFTAYFGGKQKAMQDMMLSDFTHQFFHDTWEIQDIPEGYYSEKDGVKLMSSGKIHTANEGCACTMGNVLTQFIEHLVLSKGGAGSCRITGHFNRCCYLQKNAYAFMHRRRLRRKAVRYFIRTSLFLNCRA